MATTTAFSLRQLIREVAETSVLADPGALAEEVARLVPDEHIQTAFAEMLRGYVRQVLSEDRTFPFLPQPRTTPEDKSRPRAGRPANRSRKVAGIREAWAKVLSERVHVGPAPTDWKLFGDCTVDDLDFMAGEREQIAEANHVKAEQYRKVRKLLVEHGASTVRDLPSRVLDDAFGGGE